MVKDNQYLGGGKSMQQQLYRLVITRTPIYGSSYFGRKFDISKACPKCNALAKPVGDPIIDYLEMKGKQIVEGGSESIFVDEPLKLAIQKRKFTGINFMRAVDYKNRSFEQGFYEIQATNVLPKMSSLSIFNDENFCLECRRGGYYDSAKVVTQIHYLKTDLDNVQIADFNCTWEYWGGGKLFGGKLHSRPLILVTQKVREFMQGNKIRKIKFEAVHIDG